MKIEEIFRSWIYDSTRLPIEWKTHPHDVYKIVARLFFAFVGSVIPFGLIIYYSGILRRIDKGGQEIGFQFYLLCAIFIATWLASILFASGSEEKSIMRYMFLASVGPANLVVLYTIIEKIGG